MTSIVGPAGCAKFNSSFLYYIGFVVLCVISYMWGMRNGEGKKEPLKKATSKKATSKKVTSKKKSKKAPVKKAPVEEE